MLYIARFFFFFCSWAFISFTISCTNSSEPESRIVPPDEIAEPTPEDMDHDQDRDHDSPHEEREENDHGSLEHPGNAEHSEHDTHSEAEGHGPESREMFYDDIFNSVDLALAGTENDSIATIAKSRSATGGTLVGLKAWRTKTIVWVKPVMQRDSDRRPRSSYFACHFHDGKFDCHPKRVAEEYEPPDSPDSADF